MRDEFLSEKEAAALIGVARLTLQNWRRKKNKRPVSTPRWYRIGGCYRYKRADVERWKQVQEWKKIWVEVDERN